MKIFLGGVPFGCDNIGDEAILEAVIRILRRNFDNPEICVSTAKPAQTARLFNCDAVGLIGFGKIDGNKHGVVSAIKNCDAYIWAGATGLSDYPDAAMVGLDFAQRFGKKTVVWNVGMDSELNPAHFKISGRKLALCKLLGHFLPRSFNPVEKAESLLRTKLGKRLSRALGKCDLVVLRDAQSAVALESLARVGKMTVGADSACILGDFSDGDLRCLPNSAKEALFSPCEKIGVCISSQRPVSDLSGLSDALDTLIDGGRRKVFFIPMNPATDTVVMRKIAASLVGRNDAFILDTITERRSVMAVAAHCDAVVSSRLHLLILSANAKTPIIGISRGSKVGNFLSNFGLSPIGSVEACDFRALPHAVKNAIETKAAFGETRAKAYKKFDESIGAAEQLLVDVLKERV